MKSWFVHYKNKYPGGEVIANDNEINVFDAARKLRVVIRKNGAGMWTCVSADYGLPDCHDLAPIPKTTRVWKLFKDHTVGLDELADERRPIAEAFTIDGRVPSEAEIRELFKKEKGRGPTDEEFSKICQTGLKKRAPKALPPPDAELDVAPGEEIRDVEPLPVQAARQSAQKGVGRA